MPAFEDCRPNAAGCARPDTPSIADLVDRQFAVIEPDVLWVTDITEHPTREGKLYCCVVLDAYSRRPPARGAGARRPRERPRRSA